ncbi:plasmid partition protein ParG [Corynebacterium bovis]|uniref:plasmid partition protein ParG n=1 Tax=Corynebacterium bovis TaxID=36808 RepID=UPI000F6353CC|nr:plasmid partition protein ParG [Corynebacterium bovis]
MRNVKTNAFQRSAMQRQAQEQAPGQPNVDGLLPKAKDDRIVVGFRLEEGKKRAFKEKTAREGTSIQEVLYAAVERYLDDPQTT